MSFPKSTLSRLGLLLVSILLSVHPVHISPSPWGPDQLNAQERRAAAGSQESTTRIRKSTIRASGIGSSWINLSEGRDIPTEFAGSGSAKQAFEQNLADPVGLTTADFDEDGMPDLVSGFAGVEGGFITLHRGNVDAIYPNAPEAKQRKANGISSDSPFLASTSVFLLPERPDFIGAGDFDADGHWDIVTAQAGSDKLYFLHGDGHGNFKSPSAIQLPGRTTALVTGEINRADGLTDVVIAVETTGGPEVLVFESPEGALRGRPEMFSIPNRATALVLEHLNRTYLNDLAIAAGKELIIVNGRDRKLSLDEKQRSDVPGVTMAHERMPFLITSMTAGHFVDDHRTDLALLGDDGSIHLFTRVGDSADDSKRMPRWQQNKTITLSILQAVEPGSPRIVTARVSSLPVDGLVVVDSSHRGLHILADTTSFKKNGLLSKQGGMHALPDIVSSEIEVDSSPAAVLPMRVNESALSGLVILQKNHRVPVVVAPQSAMSFSVTNTNDSGPGSLRQALLDANANPGLDAIQFNIATGAQSIVPSSILPIISDPVVIDGTTQPGFAGSPLIEINGCGPSPFRSGIVITAGASTIRGLVINNCINGGIELETIGGNRVEGNYLGTNMAGTRRKPNDPGVNIFESGNNVIGGTVPAARNLVSGNGVSGIAVRGLSPLSGNLIQGNIIGTDITGSYVRYTEPGQFQQSMGNGSEGIGLHTNSTNTVGGTTAGAGNLISGNGIDGIEIGGSGNLVQGNLIGTDASGSYALGNGDAGVTISNTTNHTIGGTTPAARNIISGNGGAGVKITETGAKGNLVLGNWIGTGSIATLAIPNSLSVTNSSGGVFINRGFNNSVGAGAENAGNLIAFNGGAGVEVIGLPGYTVGLNNAIRQNSIHSNRRLGIDLALDGVTANHSCGVATGPNNLQNFPVLNSAIGSADTTTIQGTLNTLPNTTFTLEYFSNSACDPSGYGQGERFLGATAVTTDSTCIMDFSFEPQVSVPPGRFITATATDPAGNTSEFSKCQQIVSSNVFSILPSSQSFGPSGGSDSVAVLAPAGTNWSANSRVAWITVTSGTTGSGSGTVTYTVSANGLPTARTGTVTIAGQIFTVVQSSSTGGGSQVSLTVPPGGASSTATFGTSATVRTGYVTLTMVPNKMEAGWKNAVPDAVPYGLAVFSLSQNGIVVSEAGVPASPPTTQARVFVDYRSHQGAKSDHENGEALNTDTGFAIVNPGAVAADLKFTLRDVMGRDLASGRASLVGKAHRALFIEQLSQWALDFVFPNDFATAYRFGSLEISCSQPVSIVALRLTTNQRGETLITTTPTADLTVPAGTQRLFFPQVADGNGFTTSFFLLNTSSEVETGKVQFYSNDGSPLLISRAEESGGPTSMFDYSIPPGGVYVLRSDGSPSSANTGSAQVTADPGSNTPVGAGVFGYTVNGTMVSESGIPAATPTTHARIYIDRSSGHNTGLAMASPGMSSVDVILNAYQADGVSPVGRGRGVPINGNGHEAKFASEMIPELEEGFTGVLDLSSSVPFVALTLRSLTNSRGDFLMTTFPVADFGQAAPAPVIFPQIADGGGYRTQIILLNVMDNSASTTLSFFGDSGGELNVGKKPDR